MNIRNKNFWFFGSKLNTAFLAILIVLMCVALRWMYVNQDFYKTNLSVQPQVENNKPLSMQATTELTPSDLLEAKTWVKFNPYSLVESCLGNESKMSIDEAVMKSIQQCPDKAKVILGGGVEARFSVFSISEKIARISFYKDGKMIIETPFYFSKNPYYGEIGIMYFDPTTIIISEQCSDFGSCEYFLSGNEWLKGDDFARLWLRIDNTYKRFFNSFTNGIYIVPYAINKNGDYIFGEMEGPCDECEGLGYEDKKDTERVQQKGELKLLFSNILTFKGYSFVKDSNQ